MSNETNAQADLLAATANIGGVVAETTNVEETKVVKQKAPVKTPAEKAAALRVKAAELLAQADAIEQGQAAESKFKDIAKGWGATIKVGRGDTRREVTGRVAFVSVEEGSTYVKVLVVKEDGDVDMFKVRVNEVVEATTPLCA